MRKIPKEIENPIDNIIIDIAEHFCPSFKSLKFTPNDITTLSLITGLIAAYFLYKDNIPMFSVFFILSYFFDCMDGFYAREYNMVTNFGDKYDHYKDAIVNILIVVVFIYRYKSLLGSMLIILALIPYLIQLGCQEKVYERPDSPSLSELKNMCPRKTDIRYTRYLGGGTLMIVILIIIFLTSKHRI